MKINLKEILKTKSIMEQSRYVMLFLVTVDIVHIFSSSVLGSLLFSVFSSLLRKFVHSVVLF